MLLMAQGLRLVGSDGGVKIGAKGRFPGVRMKEIHVGGDGVLVEARALIHRQDVSEREGVGVLELRLAGKGPVSTAVRDMILAATGAIDRKQIAAQTNRLPSGDSGLVKRSVQGSGFPREWCLMLKSIEMIVGSVPASCRYEYVCYAVSSTK